MKAVSAVVQPTKTNILNSVTNLSGQVKLTNFLHSIMIDNYRSVIVHADRMTEHTVDL